MNDLPATDDFEPITLKDGTTLEARQVHAIMLYCQGDLTLEQIADATGYHDSSGAYRFLTSERGRQGIRHLLITRRILDGAMVGLRTQIELARSAKSENVRHLAATDLLDRAGIKLEEEAAARPTGGGNFQININLGDSEPVTIEHTAEEQTDA